MKNKADKREAAEALPDFLNELDAAPEHLEEQFEATGDEFDAEGDEHAEFEDEQGYDDATEHGAPGHAPAAPPARRERASTTGSHSPSPGLGVFVGAACAAAGVGLGLASGVPAVAGLAAFGLQPATLILLGAVTIGVACVRRHMFSLEQRLGNGSAEETAALAADVQALVAAQREHEARAPAAGEELQHVLLLLQRQDEKINNLTKAIKMYGKPLMEIAGQATELAGTLGQVRTSIEGSSAQTLEAIARVEQGAKDGGKLADGLGKVLQAVDQLGKSRGKDVSIEPLQQQTGRIEVAVQALAQRLEDTEVRRSLVRLEDAAKKAQEEMQQLLRGEKVNAVATQLQKALDTAASRLLEGIGQLREGNLGGLESSVKEIHREVAGVATVVHQIQTAVRTGARVAAPVAPAPAVAATPAASPGPAAAGAPAKAGGPAAAGGGATGYQTGARSSSGKNVLGAIAKLKQMKN